MVDESIVQREARNISRDCDLDDDASEVLRDLLKSDEAFGALVTAQQNAVLVSTDDHDITTSVESKARRAATEAGDAIDRVIQDRKAQAQMIIAMADELEVPWGTTWGVFQAGYKAVDEIETASQSELIDAGVGRATAAKVKAAADRLEVADD